MPAFECPRLLISKSQSEVKSLRVTAIKVMDVIEFGQLDTESLETNFAPIFLDSLVYIKQLKMTSNSFQSRHEKGEKVEEGSLVISVQIQNEQKDTAPSSHSSLER